MIEKAKENWQRLKASKPGHRFKDHYYQRQQSRSDGFSLRAVFIMGLGTLVLLGGIIAVPGPGPGWLIILMGLGMFAGESMLIARFLDWVEVRLRKAVRWALASRSH
jgi:uncharacterized protein (TIGR02611 family)